MKRAHLSPLSSATRRPHPAKKTRAATARSSRNHSSDTPNPVATARAARSAYVNAFCAFLHSPSQ